MGTTEIVLLVFGIIIFIVSFVLPAKREKLSKESLKEAKEEIQKIIDEVVKEANSNLEDSVTEVSDYNVEKAERAMERLCNEKIMAINEYSSTVLESIDKNHKEVVFLYDMLNEKHNTLKDTVATVDKTAKQVKQTVQDASIEAKEVHEKKSGAVAKERLLALKDVDDDMLVEKKETAENQPEKSTAGEEMDNIVKQLDVIKSNKNKQSSLRKKSTKSKEVEAPDLNLGTVGGRKEGGRNSNERILKLHNEGKSNVAIAKELGLGIGEVKLVIDLFEGM